MTNKICHKYFMHLILFIFSVLVFCFKATTAAGGEGGNHKCIDKERHALLDFKDHLQDPAGFLSTWTSEKEEDDDCCRWNRVTCNNQTGHVTKLDLSRYYFKGALRGEISPSLLNLTYLIHLDLSYNYFNGTVPVFIGSMTRLRYLNLAWNYLYGTIPRSYGSLIELRYLDLSGNSFINGTIPIELGNLTNLQYLSLAHLKSYTIENLDWLSHLSHLHHLQLDGISLAKANNWVNVILSLHKLSFLSLWKCDLSHVMHPYSSSLNSSSSSSISTLDLGNNNLNSSMYHWLFPLTSNKLHTLYLNLNMLDGIPKYLGNLCNLTSLFFSDNSISVKFSDFLNNLSGCTSVTLQTLGASGSRLTGSLPDEIQEFSSLRRLFLAYNQLNGTISEKVWELPMLEILDVDSNFLRGAISKNFGKSNLWKVDLSNNSLEVVHISNLSHVEEFDLCSCKLGPHFPKWIQALKNFTHLNIANSGVSDTIPVEFWKMWPSRLTYLNLSSNNINGEVPDLITNFDPYYSSIDLSSNNLYGPIPNVTSSLRTLNLSKNKFYGGISFLCHITDGFLSFLDLSNNSLTGQIPDCLWHFKELIVLNLGRNNLFGRLPPSLESLINLEVLYLSNNNFSGELPLSMKNCTKINFLYMGANRFSGDVPSWIGEKLLGLYALSLTSNNFFGTIPSQLCKLVNLRILDLSMNNLYGTIPTCLNNLTAMVHDGLSPHRKVHYYLQDSPSNGTQYSQYVDHAIIKWQGSEREFSSTLGLVKSIDLSSNNLSGQIPYEITDLYQLLSLNLSNNALLGEIPWKIGEMKKLLTLDISRNKLSGRIPSRMSEITRLSYLDVSYNNLHGRIPFGTQLQSFEPSRYIGNAGLCGPPVTKYCPEDEDLDVPHVVGETRDDVEAVDELQRWFYVGAAIGFVIGFWTVCSVLLLNRRGRHAFSDFQDRFRNWVYVKVVLFIAKSHGVAHA